MSNELIKVDGALPSHDEVAGELDRLEAAGDTQALDEVARQASAYQEYEARAEALERANHFGRIKVMAEARIGSIDLALHPTIKEGGLAFGSKSVPRSKRTLWRTLGAGLQTGQLDKAIGLVESGEDGVYTVPIAKELRLWGVHHVATGPLLKRYQELYRRDGLSISEVERQIGGRPLAHVLTRPGTKPRQDRMVRPIAIQVAHALGVEHQRLKSVRQTKVSAKKPRRLRQQRALPGGRLDESYLLIRRALKELDAVAGSSGRWATEEAYDHLYKAEEIVGKALKRAA